jgi:hypothetical protein
MGDFDEGHVDLNLDTTRSLPPGPRTRDTKPYCGHADYDKGLISTIRHLVTRLSEVTRRVLQPPSLNDTAQKRLGAFLSGFAEQLCRWAFFEDVAFVQEAHL